MDAPAVVLLQLLDLQHNRKKNSINQVIRDLVSRNIFSKDRLYHWSTPVFCHIDGLKIQLTPLDNHIEALTSRFPKQFKADLQASLFIEYNCHGLARLFQAHSSRPAMQVWMICLSTIYADVLKANEFKFDKKHTFVHWCASPGSPIRTRQKPGHTRTKKQICEGYLLRRAPLVCQLSGYTLSVADITSQVVLLAQNGV